MSRRRVAVVGAGVSGIAATKACLEEGLLPVCYEQSDYVGGLWHHTEDVFPYQGAVVYEGLVTNTSKSMSCYSDFPFSENTPQYPSHLHIAQYLEEFTEQFNLRSYINLQHVVEKIEPSSQYQDVGSWFVTVTNKVTGVSERSEFDGVIICTGRHHAAYIPNIPGRESFQGEQLHTISYRNNKLFQDKNVLIVGNGSSAGDLAVDASEVAKSVVLSVGRGTWITQRLGSDGTSLPLDYSLRRVLGWIPISVVNWIIKWGCNKLIDHLFYGIAAPENKGPFYSTFLVNDKIAAKIKESKVAVKPYVSQLFARHVRFSDDSQTGEIDVILYATGYKLKWNFLPTRILPSDWKQLNLYRLVWPDNLPHTSLAVLGCSSVKGPVIPVFELQARWAAAVLSGRRHLPSSKTMRQEISRRKDCIIKRYGYLKVGTDSLPYQDELLAELGLKPSLLSMILSNPSDVFRWYFGPCFPMLYRIYGPHSWGGARNAIDEAMVDARVQQQKAIRTRNEKDKK